MKHPAGNPWALVLALGLPTLSLTGCLAEAPPGDDILEPAADAAGGPEGADLPRERAGPGILPEAVAPLAFGPPRLVGGGARAEASIAAGTDGALLVCGHGRFRGPSPAWASLDGGATWQPVGTELNPVPSGDCDVAIGEDGAWYIAYDTILSTTVAISRDLGKTWDVTFTASLPTAGHTDRPWIEARGASVFLTYCNVMALEPSACFFQRSDDGGETWTTPALIAEAAGPDAVHALVGRLVVSGDGSTVRVPFMRYTRFLAPGGHGPASFHIATSQDRGETWGLDTLASGLSSRFHFVGLTEGPDGSLYYGFVTLASEAGGRFDVHVATRAAAGPWGGPFAVAKGVSFPYVPNLWLDARPQGGALVAWHHGIGNPDLPRWAVSAALVGSDSSVVPLGNLTTPESGLDEVEFLMVRHDAAGRARIVFVRPGEECAYLGPGHCVWMLTEAEA